MATYIICFSIGVIITALVAWLLHNNALKLHMATVNERLHHHAMATEQLQSLQKTLLHEKEALLTKATKAESQNEFYKKNFHNKKKN